MNNKTEKISLRLSPEELKIIEEKLLKSNMTFSEFMRKAVLDEPIVDVKSIKELDKEIRYIENNLAQLEMLSDEGKIEIQNRDTLTDILGTINQIRQLLNENIRGD